MVEEVVGGLGFDLAVVAENNRKDIGIVCGHGLFGQQGINLGVVSGHVTQRLPAGRTLVRRLDIVLVAPRVDTVSARLISTVSQHECLPEQST